MEAPTHDDLASCSSMVPSPAVSQGVEKLAPVARLGPEFFNTLLEPQRRDGVVLL
jgi:hypothetical protein